MILLFENKAKYCEFPLAQFLEDNNLILPVKSSILLYKFKNVFGIEIISVFEIFLKELDVLINDII